MIKDEEDIEVIHPISVFFLNGLFELKEFLDENDPKVPYDVIKRHALRDLLQFLTQGILILRECNTFLIKAAILFNVTGKYTK